MIDQNVNWRNHRWSYDADYVELENVPILTQLIKQYGSFFDDQYIYIIQAKRYVIRFPHYNTPRINYRIPSEKPKDPFQKKLELECTLDNKSKA